MANIVSTYAEGTGNIAEDVSDIISDISPTQTPVLSGMGSKKIHNFYYQWLTDSLDAVAVNAAVEGADAVPQAQTTPTDNYNVTQILTKVVQVSGTLDAVQLHGREKESAYLMAKAAKAIKRDLENALVGTKQTLVNTNSSTARMMAGVQAQIPGSTSTSGNSGGVFGTGSSTTPLTETNLLEALEYCYQNGAEPNTLIVTPSDAITVTSFAQAAGKYRVFNDGTKTITNSVTLYASPFCDVKVTIDRFLAAGDSLVLDFEYWKLLVLRNWTREVLAKTGDSLNQMLIGEFSCEHSNPLASAIIRRQ